MTFLAAQDVVKRLYRFFDGILRPADDVDLSSELRRIEPYSDPSHVNNKWRYLSLVKVLHGRCMLRYEPLEHVGIFFFGETKRG